MPPTGFGSWLLAHASGEDAEALRLLRSAAELDGKTGKHPVTPGSILPPCELLGDVLLETNHAAEALAEYEASLRESPNRLNSLVGAARAAERAGRPDRAAETYRRLLAMVEPGARRPELRETRAFVTATR